jgi:hypothetical protein
MYKILSKGFLPENANIGSDIEESKLLSATTGAGANYNANNSSGGGSGSGSSNVGGAG